MYRSGTSPIWCGMGVASLLSEFREGRHVDKDWPFLSLHVVPPVRRGSKAVIAAIPGMLQRMNVQPNSA